MIRAVIIDDERLARNELKKLLMEFPEIEVIAEAANASEGIEKIDSLNPDLVFLDIQMPGKTGFDMLAELDKAPDVIFTTAYDDYALKAFEVNALDYLLKPVEPKRLADAIQKLHLDDDKEVISEEDIPVNRSLLHEQDQVFVKDGERCWNALEERLDQKVFFRANRKHIVNLRLIEKIEPYFNGGLLLELKGGEKIEVSRRQTVKFKEMMSL